MAQLSWPTTASSYVIEAKIGKGAFATVYRAKCSEMDDQLCAIKVLDLDGSSTSSFVDVQQEVQTMRLTSHPNVLTSFTSFVQGSDLWLVMQLCTKGSSLRCINAQRVLQKRSSGGLDSEAHINYILHEALLGLKYLHDNGHIHRDIKAGNILIDGQSGEVRIADFGVSGWLTSAEMSRSNTKTFVGTPCWMAPEVMEQVNGYDYKADVWSFGITILELCKGYAPYAMYPPMKVLLMTIGEDPPSFETYNDDEDYERKKDQKRRPSCEDLLNNRHFKPFIDEHFRDEQKYVLLNGLCHVIEDVGDRDVNTKNRLPGTDPIKVFSNLEEGRPKGTTWVFSDGSSVINSDFFDEFERKTARIRETNVVSSKNAEKTKEEKKKEELNDFFDEFERKTGGENFRASTYQEGN